MIGQGEQRMLQFKPPVGAQVCTNHMENGHLNAPAHEKNPA